MKDKNKLPDTETQIEKKMSKGEKLKEARQGKGLSLEVVHEATKIPLDCLRAIEEGYNIRTLSSFYYKGFLKIYAKYLDININEVVEDYKKEVLPKPIAQQEEEKFDLKKWVRSKLTRQRKQQLVILSAIIFFLILLFQVIIFFTHSHDVPANCGPAKTVMPSNKAALNQKPVQKPITSQVIPSTMKKTTPETIKAPSLSTQQTKPKPPAPVSKPQLPALKVVQSNDNPSPEPTSSPKNFPVAPPKTVPLKDVVLTVRAQKNSWMRVEVDGNVVFQSTLRRGTVETWMADKNIEISGKNLNELEFELNGKMIGTLGRRDRSAKKLIVTKEGLSVTQ